MLGDMEFNDRWKKTNGVQGRQLWDKVKMEMKWRNGILMYKKEEDQYCDLKL
jgi:hypothetical protein